MKKETIITAVIFLAVGFLAGYITEAQLNWSARQKAAQTAGPPEMPPTGAPSTSPNGGMPQQGLPEGHPPIDTESVIKQMEAAAAQNPKDADVRLNLANYLYDKKQYDKAIEWYQQALELDPKNANARTDLGTAFFYLNRPKDALREYDEALATDPAHEKTLMNAIVVSLDGMHDAALAQKYWDRLHNLNPNHPALEELKAKIDAARGAAVPH
jgi:cytochrome c-type biogenesis protein CcmH/NrfG